MLTPSSVHVVVLCAMTDPLSNNRLMVLRCVADHPGATVITLAKYLPQEMPQGTATGQLGPLQRAGLIETHRQDDRRYWVTRAGRTALRAQPPPEPFVPGPPKPVYCLQCTNEAKARGETIPPPSRYIRHPPPVHPLNLDDLSGI
jgi:DNA-binding transcriptional ArsR family regulator